jgi:hypothetical protein
MTQIVGAAICRDSKCDEFHRGIKPLLQGCSAARAVAAALREAKKRLKQRSEFMSLPSTREEPNGFIRRGEKIQETELRVVR